MMNYVFAALIIIAAVWGILSGNTAEVASAILESGGNTVELMLTITGAMTLWSGIMAIAEKSELTSYATRLLRPLLRLIMPGLDKGSDAEKYVCMNVVSNILGLGNAATPLGLKAMKAMSNSPGTLRGRATSDMITFAVLNTASIELVPTTILVLRAEHGSADPMGIMPCVWITSLISLATGLAMCFIFRGLTSPDRKSASQKEKVRHGKLHYNSVRSINRSVRTD
ncbi:MAG: spore maturation protein A [Firmicutes bacterium]|nr:spore maturation protein A [Bacillota bacterium]